MQPEGIYRPKEKRILGIIEEGESKWERRAPITPRGCQFLLETVPRLSIHVQSSINRHFSDVEYRKVGCKIVDQLQDCNLILGVKQVKPECFSQGKTFAFYSHTIKAQPQNMKMLDEMLRQKIRMIDYEKICNEKGERLIASGEIAGFAGVVNIFSGLGTLLMDKKKSSIFLELAQGHRYPNKAEASKALRKVGEELKERGFAKELVPFVVGVVGNSKCANGAIEALRCFNAVFSEVKRNGVEIKKETINFIDPGRLEKLVKDLEDGKAKKDDHCKFIYVVKFDLEHLVEKISGANQAFSKRHYFQNPEEYHSIFENKWLRHISVLINCLYWEPKFPRLISIKSLRDLVESKEKISLMAISDVSCDFEGPIEFLTKYSTIDEPFLFYKFGQQLLSEEEKKEVSKDSSDSKEDWGCLKIYNKTLASEDGFLYMPIENLPSEFPYDSSMILNDQLVKLVPKIIDSDPNMKLSEQKLPSEILGAIITLNGFLTPKYRYISKLRHQTNNYSHCFTSKFKELHGEIKLKRVKITGHIFDQDVLRYLMDQVVEKEKKQLLITNIKIGVGPSITSECEILIQEDNKDEMFSKAILKLFEEKCITFTEAKN